MPSEKQIEAAKKALSPLRDTYVDRDDIIKIITAAEQAEPAPTYDAPLGAIENGRVFLQRLVDRYDFQCEAGGLANCSDYHEVVRCFEAMAEWIYHHAPAARSGAVKVKPLEWKDERNCECSAETVIGTYEVGFDDGWWAQLEGGVKWDWNPPYDPRSYEGPSAAKAAAQADYERRILAALEPSEPATDAEPVAWLYDWVDDDGATKSEASTNRISSVNFKPTSNVRPLYTRPPESRLREALEGLLEVHEALGAGNSYAAKKARAALAQGGRE